MSNGGPRTRCAFCGREVHDTRHRREGFAVDYYFINTGRLKRMESKGAQSENGNATVRVLSDVKRIPVCVDCMSRPEVHGLWDSGFPDSDEFASGK